MRVRGGPPEAMSEDVAEDIEDEDGGGERAPGDVLPARAPLAPLRSSSPIY